MELNRDYYGAIISYNLRRGMTHQSCIDDFNSTLGDKALSNIVYCWFSDVNRGRRFLKDETIK